MKSSPNTCVHHCFVSCSYCFTRSMSVADASSCLYACEHRESSTETTHATRPGAVECSSGDCMSKCNEHAARWRIQTLPIYLTPLSRIVLSEVALW